MASVLVGESVAREVVARQERSFLVARLSLEPDSPHVRFEGARLFPWKLLLMLLMQAMMMVKHGMHVRKEDVSLLLVQQFFS